ncbi:MAG: hyalin [Pirellulaceae bacterium]|nr:MAG: hyalin [Pirellulaceae bacterium]
MELDQLRYFLKIAELENITRAAEALGVSQSALSRSVQRLEEELGRPLLERKTRRVVVTEAGNLLRRRAKEILALLDDTKTEIMDDGSHGRLRIGAIPTIAPYFLPPVLQDFAADHPEATLMVQEMTTDALIKQCKEGDIDVAVVSLPIDVRYLDVEPLFEEELLLAVSPQHPLAKKRRIEPTDLMDQPFILLDELHCLSDQVLTYCHQQLLQPVVVERTSQLAMVQELVAMGHGVSLVPAMAVRCDASKRRLYRRIVNPTPRRTIAAMWNPYRFVSRLQTQFRQTLMRYGKQAAADTAEGSPPG